MITVARVGDDLKIHVNDAEVWLSARDAVQLNKDLTEALKEIPYWVHDGSQWYGPFVRLEFMKSTSQVMLNCYSAVPSRSDMLGFYLNWSGNGKIIRSDVKPA